MKPTRSEVIAWLELGASDLHMGPKAQAALALIQTDQAAYAEGLREALEDCLTAIPFCEHEDTHRGGAIWTICDSCGYKWADDQPPLQRPVPMPKAMVKALAALAAPPSKAKLRPMSEAPKGDGDNGSGAVLLYASQGTIPIICQRWMPSQYWFKDYSSPVYTDADFIGWLPLPVVEP